MPISQDEVHVWKAELALPSLSILKFADTLLASEIQRANRLRHAQERDRFVAGRGILRSLLGNYLKRDARDISILNDSNGKPRIEGDLEFNVSHSGDTALFVFSKARRLGVDIEVVRGIPDASKIVEWFFSREEFENFCALPESERTLAFFRSWTRKEAYLKALGTGLSHSLKSVPLEFSNGEWSIQELNVGPGHVATLAVEGFPSPAIREMNWNSVDCGAVGDIGFEPGLEAIQTLCN